MKVEHQGFKVTGMTGNISADIQDDGSYTEITLTGMCDPGSFDLEGLSTLIDDLEQVQGIAQQVDRTNERNRGASE